MSSHNTCLPQLPQTLSYTSLSNLVLITFMVLVTLSWHLNSATQVQLKVTLTPLFLLQLVFIPYMTPSLYVHMTHLYSLICTTVCTHHYKYSHVFSSWTLSSTSLFLTFAIHCLTGTSDSHVLLHNTCLPQAPQTLSYTTISLSALNLHGLSDPKLTCGWHLTSAAQPQQRWP